MPWEEYRYSYNINYDESGNRLHKLLRKSKFSRICVTSRLHGDFRWLKGDPALQKRNVVKKKVTMLLRKDTKNELANLKKI